MRELFLLYLDLRKKVIKKMNKKKLLLLLSSIKILKLRYSHKCLKVTRV